MDTTGKELFEKQSIQLFGEQSVRAALHYASPELLEQANRCRVLKKPTKSTSIVKNLSNACMGVLRWRREHILIAGGSCSTVSGANISG